MTARSSPLQWMIRSNYSPLGGSGANQPITSSSHPTATNDTILVTLS
jgi:hypothetical protein